MTQGEMFWRLLFSIVLLLGGVREYRRGNVSLGVFMLAIPVAAWAAWSFGS
jgi:hypothetical protein